MATLDYLTGYCIYCETEEQIIETLLLAQELGYTWHSGAEILPNGYYPNWFKIRSRCSIYLHPESKCIGYIDLVDDDKPEYVHTSEMRRSMTLDEIEKALGFKVLIVEEK